MSKKWWAAGISGAVLAAAGYFTQVGENQDIPETRNNATTPENNTRNAQITSTNITPASNLASPFTACSANGQSTSLPACPPSSSRTPAQQAEIEELKSKVLFNLKEAQDTSRDLPSRFYSYIATMNMLEDLSKTTATDADLTADIRDQKAITAQFVSIGNQILDERRLTIGQPPQSPAQAAAKAQLMSHTFDLINRMNDYAGVATEDSYRRLGFTNSDAFSEAMFAASTYKQPKALVP